MNALATAAKELWGLFVDDGKLALGLLVWCAIAGLLFGRLPMTPGVDSLVLAAGCIVVLVVTVFAAARRRAG